MGLFVLSSLSSQAVGLEAVALGEVMACVVVIGDNGVRAEFVVGERCFESEGSELTLVFVPRGERFRFATRNTGELGAVMLVVDPMATLEAYGLEATRLPESLLRTIDAKRTAMEKLAPGRFGMIATDMVSRRGLLSSVAPLYYEGKSLELLATVLSQVSCREDSRACEPRDLERLRVVKRIIERAPQRALDIDALARTAAMNRTKLRALFKQAFGTTLRAYRTTILLQQADRALKERSCTVERIAYGAGYANASSFIVAYKRHFGVSPGLMTRISRPEMLRL
jgi:AraC-like DNA-binding protein